MNGQITLSASLLSANFACLERDIRAAEEAGVDWFHIDVMDGHFVPNITMGPFIAETIRKITALPLDVHLMITNPQDFIPPFAKAGADYIAVHVENQPHIHKLVQSIHDHGCKATVVINPGTPASALAGILPEVDMVLVMSVNPGFSGQKFIKSAPAKIATIAGMLESLGSEIPIQVDGGITDQTIAACRLAGASNFVSASYIFHHPDGISSAVAALRQAAK